MNCNLSPFGEIYGNEAIVSASTLPSAYHFALLFLNNYGMVSNCPDWNTTQKELSMTMIVEDPLSEPMISLCIPCGPEELEQYRQEMLYGILDFEVRGGKWPYTYHQRMVHWGVHPAGDYYGSNQLYSRGIGDNQIDFIIEELMRNPSSRRAVIDIRDNSQDMFTNDPACLQHIQFFIRDGKLHMKVLFRSNDAVKAAFMNAFALIQLQKMILQKLQKSGMYIQMGTYTHRANSFHCYERDFGTLNGYVKRIRQYYNGESDPPAAFYYGDWADQMREAAPKIEQKVRELEKQQKQEYLDALMKGKC